MFGNSFQFFSKNVKEPYTRLELESNLAIANTVTPAGLGAHPNMQLLIEFQSPAKYRARIKWVVFGYDFSFNSLS